MPQPKNPNRLVTFDIGRMSLAEVTEWGASKHSMDSSFEYTYADMCILRKWVVMDSFASKTGWGVCGISGDKKHPLFYDVHHLDPSTKEGRIRDCYRSSPAYMGRQSIIDELSTCALLTKENHAALHYGLYSNADIDSVFNAEHYRHNISLLETHFVTLGYVTKRYAPRVKSSDSILV